MRFRGKRDENQLSNISIKSENFWVLPQCGAAGKKSEHSFALRASTTKGIKGGDN